MTVPEGTVLVLLDTSALISPFQTGVDFVRGIREMVAAPIAFAVTDGTVRELESISRKGSATISMAARKALAFTRGLRVLRTDAKRTDEGIVSSAEETGAAVATADSDLRAELRRRTIPVFSVSRGKRIRIDGSFPAGTIV